MGLLGKIAELFRGSLDEEFYENIEDILIEGDFGAKNAMYIGDCAREAKPKSKDELVSIIRKILSEKISSVELMPKQNELSVYLVLGVNGVGKTTSIAKLAKYYSESGVKTLLAASDTFRAAAIDQLELHAEKTGTRIIRQNNGSDPGAVIFDAITSAESRNEELILCDTAGRMHNREDLVRELQKIDKIIRNRVKPANYRKILVLDSTTGQNSVSQAEIFNSAIGIDALILTKYDSASKAGFISQIPIPVAFLGTGETYKDLKKFDVSEFIDSLLDL